MHRLAEYMEILVLDGLLLFAKSEFKQMMLGCVDRVQSLADYIEMLWC